MSKNYQNQNPNTSVNSDEDDEFGGGKITVDKLYRNRTKSFTPVEQPKKLDSDEDDEFGGGKITVELLNRNKSKVAVPSTVPDEDSDDEFGGGKITVDKLRKKSNFSNLVLTPTINTPTPPTDEDEYIYSCDYNIFSPTIPTNQWYVDREKLYNSVKFGNSITIPLVIDTEYTENIDGKKEYQQKSRLGLTTQICGIGIDTPRTIYAHTERVNMGRVMADEKLLPLIGNIFHPIDYLNSVGLNVQVWEATESELTGLPKCFTVLYGHFLTAEINMIAEGTIKNRIKQLQQSQGEEQISSGRRAFCQKIVDGMKLDWVSLKHVISIEGYEYELCLKIVDTGAIHGVASYKDFCDSVGWKLKYKDKFTSEEKSKMLDMAIERFKDFENYALGDLEVYEALNSYYEKWNIVYEKLNLSEYYQCPKLTIGGTVKDLFEAALASKLEIQATDKDGESIWREELNEIIEQFIKPTSANDLRQFSTHTRALLAKVEGGRCRNNRPTDVFSRRKIKGQYDACLICDIDISGCYGEGQRNQSYFLGNPEIFDYKACKNNEYITLREWLKAYEVDVDALIKAVNEKDAIAWQNPDNWGELVSGAWYARMSTRERLKYSQDYFASWFTESADKVDLLAKSIRNMKSDTEMTTTDWSNFDEECGSLKIFNHEIWNGVITHDGLQWILAICSPRQRNELLDNLQILASAVYPRSQKLNDNHSPKESLELLKTQYENWEGRNTTERVKVNGRSKIVMNFDECHAWFDINLGELLVNDLLIERKKAQKVYGKKSPLDVLFKLCVNTLYGDMVSKYFITSNPVCGNNITARARCLAWYMEKGFHGWQSITDGCAFELNGVIYAARDNINGEIVNQHRHDSKLKNWKIKRGAIANTQEILGKWDEITYTKWKDDKAETVTEKFLNLNIDGRELAPKIIPDPEHEGCEIVITSAMGWIDETAMQHLQSLFSLVDVLHKETTSIKINDDLSPSFKPRIGQFSFETKDVYHSGSFHGSANYLLSNPNGTFVKARGYETKRNHTGIETIAEGDEITFLKSERYGVKKNPAKDFLQQLLDNPENIQRQLPAIKSGILKISDYKNLASKYDELGIEPGDSILRSFLLQEFSLSQFTFQTYEQYMMWKKIISHLKDTDKQSLEGYFLNDDHTLNFVKLCEWVDEKIAEGVDKPFDLLTDLNRHDRRAEKRAKNPVECGRGKNKKQKIVSLSHPHLQTLNKLKEQLNDGSLTEISEE